MNIYHPAAAETAAEMRTAINELRYNSPIVSSTMTLADINKMSAEDRYTVLAYHALAALAKSQQAHLEDVINRPATGGYQPIGSSGPVQPPPRKP
jgi:hypothetical protein